MSQSSGFCQGAMHAVLVGVAILAANPVRAQDPPPRKNTAPRFPAVDDFQPTQRTLEDNVLHGYLTDYVNLVNPTDELLGATLRPVSPALRAQLGLAAEQGLVVLSLRGDGPSAQAGLKQNDILVSLADKPLASVDDLSKGLKAAGEAAVPLKVLRASKPLTLLVRPSYRVTLSPVAQQKSEYYIGVSLEPADDALRAQLGLPAGQGVVVKEVVSGSRAEKAGIKQHDVLLEVADKPVGTPEAVAQQIQATGGKATRLSVLHGGKREQIEVTPSERKVEVRPAQESFLYWRAPAQNWVLTADPAKLSQWSTATLTSPLAESADDVRQRLDRLEKEMQALRKTLDQVNETLKGTKRD